MEHQITLRVTYKDTKLSGNQLANSLRNLSPTAQITVITDKQVVGAGYHRPVCPKCNVELHPERNGVGVLDMSNFGPYSLWDSDLWKCPTCGVEVLGGFGSGPLSAHYQDDFERVVEAYKAKGLLVKNQG